MSAQRDMIAHAAHLGGAVIGFIYLKYKTQIIHWPNIFKQKPKKTNLKYSSGDEEKVDYYRKKINQPISIDNNVFSSFFDENGSWENENKPQEWQFDDSNLLDDADFQQILNQCLDALPDQWSTSVKLKYLMNKKGDEICQELNITPSNYWQILHRAKLLLIPMMYK